MYRELLALEKAGTPIRVAVLGAGGSMGRGLAHQCGTTPGIRLVAAIDLDLSRAEAAAALYRNAGGSGAGEPVVAADPDALLAAGRDSVDVLVESTTSVAAATRSVELALRSGIDVVLMNAEVDCLLGPSFHRTARESGTVVSSDAGDQHGVLMRMVDEARLWGFEIVMAGNIKGFLDRSATAVSIADEARKRRLNPVMCAAYTDGTKLNVEMALVANATGLVPARRGMTGPRAASVHEVFDKFDLGALRDPGVVDYILGAEPGGGVFVVGYSDEPERRDYLSYYKMGDGPYYLFYRPYHLCHLETSHAIAQVALHRQPLFAPLERPVAEVIAVAKTDLAPGTVLDRAIGSDHVYGEIAARPTDGVPICLLESGQATMARAVGRGDPLTWDDVLLPEGELLAAWRRQEGVQ